LHSLCAHFFLFDENITNNLHEFRSYTDAQIDFYYPTFRGCGKNGGCAKTAALAGSGGSAQDVGLALAGRPTARH
jgi:hypothetical protein